jgi:hypothetical protein
MDGLSLGAVIAGFAANIVTTVFYLLLGVSLFAWYLLTERRPLCRFFGVTATIPRIRIYVSRLEIKPGGTTGFEPIVHGYSGPAMDENEYIVALELRRSLSYRLLAFLPTSVREWLGRRSVTIRELDPPIDLSPRSLAELGNDNVITLGSGIYNLVSRYYLEHYDFPYYFTRDQDGEWSVVARHPNGADAVFPENRSNGWEIGVVGRLRSSTHGKTVVVCAGFGPGTYGSAHYLCGHWRELHSEFGDDDFGICLGWHGQPPIGRTFVDPVRLHSSRRPPRGVVSAPSTSKPSAAD